MGKVWLAWRAVLAVVLMIGFYLTAVAIALGLLFIPYAEYAYGHRLHVRLAVFCVAGAAIILWSVLPRIERFAAPGPRLTPDKHPRLFRELTGVANAAQQEMPKEVYLVPDVNAWVGQRGGVMGFFSKRVMGLGLPLLRALKVSEMRAVLAHEFGHYYGGDTKLGPWVYKTRAAIGRTLANLSRHSSVIQAPFVWYGNMFLRVTHAVSRRQEYAADALAARVVGARALMDGLRTIHAAALAYDVYWRSEYVPVLIAGFRPPMSEGFAAFLEAKDISKALSDVVEKEMHGSERDPYDTHPALRDRIQALCGLPEGDALPSDPPAIALLDELERLEKQLLAMMGGQEHADRLRPLAWQEAGSRVYLPMWTQRAQECAEGLSGMTPRMLPDLAANPQHYIPRFEKWLDPSLPADVQMEIVRGIVGSALAVALDQRGCRLLCDVGCAIQFRCGETTIEPFSLVTKLGAGALTAEAWQRQSADLGIADLNLGRVTADSLVKDLPAARPAPRAN